MFVKASTDPERLEDYLTEAAIAEHLPLALATPRLRGAAQHAGWVLLWSDALDAHHPAQPWTAHDTRLVINAIEQRIPLLTPSPVPALRAVASMVGDAFRVWTDLVAARPRAVGVEDLDAWTAEHPPVLARLEESWPTAAAGQTLCHFDPRADNYLLDQGGALWTIDWSRACLAAPWVDLATFLVTPGGDGHDAEQLFWSSPLSKGAGEQALNAHLAVLAGYWLNAVAKTSARSDERMAELLDYQQRSLDGAMTWLRQRLRV
ncbi:MAG: phosphotransferase [Quadrisphaera sp.]